MTQLSTANGQPVAPLVVILTLVTLSLTARVMSNPDDGPEPDDVWSATLHRSTCTTPGTYLVLECPPEASTGEETLMCLDQAVWGVRSPGHHRCQASDTDYCVTNALADDTLQHCLGSATCRVDASPRFVARCRQHSTYLYVRYSCILRSRVLPLGEPGSLQTSHGFVQSPEYPNPPPDGTTATCHVTSADLDPAHLRLSVIVVDFHVGGVSHPSTCEGTRVELEGSGTHMLMCGWLPRGRTASFTSEMTASYSGGGDTAGRGFWIEIKGSDARSGAPAEFTVSCENPDGSGSVTPTAPSGDLLDEELHNLHVSKCTVPDGRLHLSCPADPITGHAKVIFVQNVFLGRSNEMRRRCHHIDADTCTQAAYNRGQTACMGRARCSLDARPTRLTPCGRHSEYMQAEYSCIPEPSLFRLGAEQWPLFFSSGYLLSPNYPNPPPEGANVSCHIYPTHSVEYFRLTLTSLDIDLGGAGCENELRVDDVFDSQSVCGGEQLQVPLVMQLSTDIHLVYSVRGSQTPGHGFWLRLQGEDVRGGMDIEFVVDCNQAATDTTQRPPTPLPNTPRTPTPQYTSLGTRTPKPATFIPKPATLTPKPATPTASQPSVKPPLLSSPFPVTQITKTTFYTTTLPTLVNVSDGGAAMSQAAMVTAVGGALGGAALIIALLLTTVCVCRARRRKSSRQTKSPRVIFQAHEPRPQPSAPSLDTLAREVPVPTPDGQPSTNYQSLALASRDKATDMYSAISPGNGEGGVYDVIDESQMEAARPGARADFVNVDRSSIYVYESYYDEFDRSNASEAPAGNRPFTTNSSAQMGAFVAPPSGQTKNAPHYVNDKSDPALYYNDVMSAPIHNNTRVAGAHNTNVSPNTVSGRVKAMADQLNTTVGFPSNGDLGKRPEQPGYLSLHE